MIFKEILQKNLSKFSHHRGLFGQKFTHLFIVSWKIKEVRKLVEGKIIDHAQQ